MEADVDQRKSGIFEGAALALCALVAVACTSGDAPEAPPSQAAAPAPSAPVIGAELFVDVEAEPDEGVPPLAVQFVAMVEDNEGPVDCEWDFGDGSAKKTGLRPQHVYSEVADYEILVVCKDSTGIEGEGETDVFVEDEEPPSPARP